jgi:DNA-3-methyladenine glycosylase II
VALTSIEEMQKHVRAIAKADPAFKPIIKASPLCTINSKRPKQGHYETLVTSIISQQLAIKAADTIFARVKTLANGEITPESLQALSAEELRAAGVSGAKARAISELTEATLSGAINFKKFSRLSNEEISAELTALWGIGRWTVEMFLIFHLGRLDLWPVGDLAVRRGWEKIHSLDYQIEPKALDLLSDKFAGRESIVAWYCWRATEGDSSSW